MTRIKEHCCTSWDAEETTVIIVSLSCASYFLLICSPLGYFLASKCEIPLILRLQIFCLCAVHCPPSLLSSTCFLVIKLHLHSLSFLQTSISSVTSFIAMPVLLVPIEGVIEDAQNSHYNEQWQDVTHSATDQPPARCCHPCTHPAESACLCDVTRTPHRVVLSAEQIGLLMNNIYSLPCSQLGLTWQSYPLIFTTVAPSFGSSGLSSLWYLWSPWNPRESCPL